LKICRANRLAGGFTVALRQTRRLAKDQGKEAEREQSHVVGLELQHRKLSPC
jgi:hypothetical protein